jgi:hypothetical protein
MMIGTINLGSTPCCGFIHRSYDCYPDERSETGWTHNPGGNYAPGHETFVTEEVQLKQGICPDCGKSFEWWLKMNGHKRFGLIWTWDYSQAQRDWMESQKAIQEYFRLYGDGGLMSL